METSKKLTEAGSEASTLSVEDSPANPTALQENVKALVTSVRSGLRCFVLYARRSPFGYWERTSAGCFPLMEVEPSEPSSMTWPRWATAWDGACTELPTLALAIGDYASSSLPSPDTQNHRDGSKTRKDLKGKHSLSLHHAVGSELLPTPVLPTPRANKVGGYSSPGYRPTLEQAFGESEELPTPRSCTAMQAAINPDATFPNLETVVAGETGERGWLNPSFVEMMMGFPLGWSDLVHSETP